MDVQIIDYFLAICVTLGGYKQSHTNDDRIKSQVKVFYILSVMNHFTCQCMFFVY